MMSADYQYMTNADGRKTAVIIPIEEWERISALLPADDALQAIGRSIREAMREVKMMKAGKQPEMELIDFLDEL